MWMEPASLLVPSALGCLTLSRIQPGVGAGGRVVGGRILVGSCGLCPVAQEREAVSALGLWGSGRLAATNDSTPEELAYWPAMTLECRQL
ncbi:unnamed protein product [Calypogeia fissa]